MGNGRRRAKTEASAKEVPEGLTVQEFGCSGFMTGLGKAKVKSADGAH